VILVNNSAVDIESRMSYEIKIVSSHLPLYNTEAATVSGSIEWETKRHILKNTLLPNNTTFTAGGDSRQYASTIVNIVYILVSLSCQVLPTFLPEYSLPLVSIRIT